MVERSSSASSTVAPAAHGTARKNHHEVKCNYDVMRKTFSDASLHLPRIDLVEVASPDRPSQHYSTIDIYLTVRDGKQITCARSLCTLSPDTLLVVPGSGMF